MMRRLTLTEFKTQTAVPLSASERDDLRRIHTGLRVEPTLGSEDCYDITPDQHIGVISLPSLIVEIRPKLGISAVLFLVSYASEVASWFDQQPEFQPHADFAEVIAIVLARLVEHATRRGLLNGYQSEEETLATPRGRILFDEQIRRRLGTWPPVEVRHDVFTSDILENRLLLAALCALGRISRSTVAQRELFRAQRLFGAVRLVHFAPARVPDIFFTRLNSHYLPAVSLASLVLRSCSVDIGAGTARGSAFLIDMNTVFERFLRRALRSELNLETAEFPDRAPAMHLDLAGIVPLKPDLSLICNQRVVWVGDAKYKRMQTGDFRNADLYQLLAYLVALDLPAGALIYAADEGVATSEFAVANSDKRLHIEALDLSLPPRAIQRQVATIADRIGLRAKSRAASFGQHSIQARSVGIGYAPEGKIG